MSALPARLFSLSRLLAFALVFVQPVCSFAQATYCIRAGATGSGTGADWTNAYSSIPSSLARGATYYVAGGTYAGHSFSTANSGTTTITIKKATVADHGSATGWLDTYGTAQAVFTGTLSFNTGYWILNGQTGAGTGNVTPYGFFINTGEGSSAIDIGNTSSNPTANVSVSYVEMQGVATLGDYNYTQGTKPLYVGYSTNASASHCYIHGGESLVDTETGVAGTGSTGLSVTYCYLQASRSINTNYHSNVFYCTGANNGVFAYNVIFNYNDEGLFFTGYQASPANWLVYGNVFYSTNTGESNPRGIELRQDYNYSGILIYNNTFVNLGVGGILNRTGETGNKTTGSAAQNNIGLASPCSELGDFSPANNNSTVTSAAFVNAASYDFRLAKALPGVALAATYSIDPLGVTRGADGVWDQGAFEFNAGTGSVVPPSNAKTAIVVP